MANQKVVAEEMVFQKGFILMTSTEYKREIELAERELDRLNIERDRVAGEIETLRSLRRGAFLREMFEREYACLTEPTFIEIVDAVA